MIKTRINAKQRLLATKKVVDLSRNSKLMKWAEDYSFGGSYTKSDWEQDKDLTKFRRFVEDLPEDKRLACLYCMEDYDRTYVEEALKESRFSDMLELKF